MLINLSKYKFGYKCHFGVTRNGIVIIKNICILLDFWYFYNNLHMDQ